MRLEVRLELESPLSILRQRGMGNQLGSLRFVPGRAWRGALAAEVMRERNLDAMSAHGDGVFKGLFLDRKVRFGDLRPEGAFPWPLSARECSLDPARRGHTRDRAQPVFPWIGGQS